MKTRLACFGVCAVLLMHSPFAFAQSSSSSESLLERLPVAVEFEGAAGFSTDHIVYGLSESLNQPKVEGSVGWSLPNVPLSPSVGLAAASINQPGGIELGYSVGVGQTIEPISLGIGWTFFHYPASDPESVEAVETLTPTEERALSDEARAARAAALAQAGDDGDRIDYYEVYVDLGAEFELGAVGFSYAFSPDYFGNSGVSHYFGGNWDVPLPLGIVEGVSLNGHVGYKITEENDDIGVPDYLEWEVGLAYSWEQFDFGIAYVDTELTEEECFGGGNTCDARAVFSMGVNF